MDFLTLSSVFSDCRMKHATPLKQRTFVGKKSRDSLPMFNCIVERQKTLNVVDYMLIPADLI